MPGRLLTNPPDSLAVLAGLTIGYLLVSGIRRRSRELAWRWPQSPRWFRLRSWRRT